MRDNEVVDLSRNAWGRVIDRGTIDWIVSNRSIELAAHGMKQPFGSEAPRSLQASCSQTTERTIEPSDGLNRAWITEGT